MHYPGFTTLISLRSECDYKVASKSLRVVQTGNSKSNVRLLKKRKLILRKNLLLLRTSKTPHFRNTYLPNTIHIKKYLHAFGIKRSRQEMRYPKLNDEIKKLKENCFEGDDRL